MHFKILSAWFYENEGEPDYLYITLIPKNIDTAKTKQHLVVIWEHEGVHCAAGLYIGNDEVWWFSHQADYGQGF